MKSKFFFALIPFVTSSALACGGGNKPCSFQAEYGAWRVPPAPRIQPVVAEEQRPPLYGDDIRFLRAAQRNRREVTDLDEPFSRLNVRTPDNHN